jgi:hypothetical protein
VRIAATAGPSLPPTRLAVEDKMESFTTRLRASTLAAIESRARQEGVSLKLVICRALAKDGIEVADADLEDRTPRRQRAA